MVTPTPTFPEITQTSQMIYFPNNSKGPNLQKVYDDYEYYDQTNDSTTEKTFILQKKDFSKNNDSLFLINTNTKGLDEDQNETSVIGLQDTNNNVLRCFERVCEKTTSARNISNRKSL